MTDPGLDRAGGTYRLERHVGTASGIAVEVWQSLISGDVELVVCPSVQGFRTVARGGMGEVSLLADIGGAVLRALEGTAPLLSGEWFRRPRSGISEQV